MKKSQLILAAAALVALASCSNEGYTPSSSLENEIGFNAVARKATRANNTIFTSSVYDTLTNNSFQVWGWQSESGDFTASELADNAASNFMTNLTISWTSGRDNSRAKAWRNVDNYYYWPFTGKISFLAIHPSTVAPNSTGWDATNKKPKAKIENYTVTGKDSTDLMFATAEGARRADALPMSFNHALAQIQFRVRTNADYALDTVEFKVDSVKFNNIALSGDVTYANNAISWDNIAAQTSGKDYYKITQVVNYKATDADADLYGRALVMIPQPANVLDNNANPVDDVQTTLTIGYTMKQKNNAEIHGTVDVPAPQEWAVGSKYLYTLNFNLNEITFNPSVNDWVVVNVATINVP